MVGSQDTAGEAAWFREILLLGRVRRASVWSLALAWLWLACLSLPAWLLLSAPLACLSLAALFPYLASQYLACLALGHSPPPAHPAPPPTLLSQLAALARLPALATLTCLALQAGVAAWALLGTTDPAVIGCSILAGIQVGLGQVCQPAALEFPVLDRPRSTQLYSLVSRAALERAGRAAVWLLPRYLAAASLHSLATAAALPAVLNPQAVLSCLLSVTLVQLTHSARFAVFSVFLTAPLERSLPELLDGLSSPAPLHALLASRALAGLVRSSPQARQELYSLSQPGGHPTHWNAVRTACLSTISPPVPAKPQQTPVWSPAPGPATPGLRRLGGVAGPGRGGGVVGGAAGQVETVTPAPPAPPRPLPRAARPAVAVLASLAAASLSEDRFGVVQKDLPAILAALTNLDTKGQPQLAREVQAALYRYCVVCVLCPADRC